MNGEHAPADSKMLLELDVFKHIPLAAAMQIRVTGSTDLHLTLAAPLTPNLNHEGIAFGGAIECLGTLACWGLLWLRLAAPEAMIVIQHAETEFITSITGELRAEARAPDAEIWERFVDQFSRRGRSRIELAATIGDATQTEAARFRGRFVATRKTRTTA